MRKFFLVILALGLGFVISTKFVFAFLVPEVEPTLEQGLAETIPAEMRGWRSKKVPLSDTPEGEDRVLDVLDLDDVFCRQYVKGDTEVMIYVAYR